MQSCQQFRINMAQSQSTHFHISLKVTLHPHSHTCTCPGALNIVALDTLPIHLHISDVQSCQQFRINKTQFQPTYFHISLKVTLHPQSYTCTRPAAVNKVAPDTVAAGCGIRTKAAEGTTGCKQKYFHHNTSSKFHICILICFQSI